MDSFAGLLQLRQAYVPVVSTCDLKAQVTKLCGQAVQSTVLEPLLHLTLGELSAACQLAEGQRCGLAEPASDGSTHLAEAEQPGPFLQLQEHIRAGHAARLLTALLLLALRKLARAVSTRSV